MSTGRALYQIQKIELTIIEHSKRIKAINVQLQDDAELKQAQADCESAEAALKEIARRIKDREAQIEAVASKRQATETRLYSGTVGNPKELQDMQMEIESLTRRRADLDEALLLMMMEHEEAAQTFQHSESSLHSLREKHTSQHQQLRAEKAALTQKAERLMSERRAALKQVEPAALKTYASLRTAKANRPVAVLKEGACTVCGIAQNRAVTAAVARAAKLVNCHSCGRILVRL